MKLDFLNRFDFFTGVPDSQLKPLCNYLMATYGIGHQHIIAANEGNAVGLAAGYHLATGKVPVVYLQNSGLGNIINPVASLLNDQVYAIPCLFVVGWRGEPGVKDEPQHIYQGAVTLQLLADMDIASMVIDSATTEAQVEAQLNAWQSLFLRGKQCALVVKKGALEWDGKMDYRNDFPMLREEIIRHIVAVSGEDPIVSTTGKASRELFEIRESLGQGHSHDFLTVGSMGHSSSIALGIALQKPEQKVWVIDGDGSSLMHLGAMAVMGQQQPRNVVHIVVNNQAHETVGGQPTAATSCDFVAMALACHYAHASRVDSPEALDAALQHANTFDGLCLIEVRSAIGARPDLGRPTTSAQENKQSFMQQLLASQRQ